MAVQGARVRPLPAACPERAEPFALARAVVGYRSTWWVEDPEGHAQGATVSTPRAVWAAALALLVLHAALAWVGRAPGILTGQDDVRYLVLARSLSEGTYRDLLWPGAPLHHMYPPGYPALLALWRAIGGESFDWLITLQVLLSTSALALLFDAMRRQVAPIVALATLALCAINPSALTQAGAVTSEPALMCAVALCIWASCALAPGARRDTLLLLAAVAATLMRSAGMVVPLALIGVHLQARRWRAAAVAAVVGLPVLGALLWWTLTDPAPVVGSSYAADLVLTHAPNEGVLANLIERFRINFLFYMVRAVPSLLATPTIEGTILDNLVVTGVLVLTLVSGLYAAYSRLPMLAWILVGTLGLLLAWSWQVTRYVTPVVPLLIASVLLGGWRLGQRVAPRAGMAVVLLLMLPLAVEGGTRTAQQVASVRACSRAQPLPDLQCIADDQRTFIEASRYVRDSLPSAARVLSAKSATMFYYSGRVTVPYQRYQNLGGLELRDSSLAQGAEYLTISNLQTSERSKLIRVLMEDCRYLGIVKEFSRRTLLLRWSTTPLPDTASACPNLERYILDPELLEEFRELQVFKPKQR